MDKRQKPFMTVEEVSKILWLSRQTIYNRIKTDPTFIKPIKLSKRKTVFLREDFEKWFENLKRSK